jgi:hypothetical protein
LKGVSRIVTTVFRNCHVFLEAFGTANGNKYAGVDVLELADGCIPKRRYNCATGMMEDEDVEKVMARFKTELKALLR